MDIIGCTISYCPSQTVNLGVAKMTVPDFFHIRTFYLARSKGGRLIWKSGNPSYDKAGLFFTETEAKEYIENKGWVLLKKKRVKIRSFHWYKEGDIHG